MQRTRIKICGITRAEDLRAAVDHGADAIGFNCYPRSPRFVAADRLHGLAAALPPFVTPVLLFVNAGEVEVNTALASVPQAVLQFHGDETRADCERFGRPYIRALRMSAGVDLLDCERQFSSAMALLADAPSSGYGGSGATFDWDRLPLQRGMPLVLAGGLNESNVAGAISRLRPFAVDIASGVEVAPGVKSVELLRRFCAAVHAADRRVSQEQ